MLSTCAYRNDEFLVDERLLAEIQIAGQAFVAQNNHARNISE